MQIKGKEIITVKAKSGTEKLIHDVYYIHGLAHNLLSVGQLIQKGHSVFFPGDPCEIMPLVKIHMANNKMFPLEISCLDDYTLGVNVRNDSWILALALWTLALQWFEVVELGKVGAWLSSIFCIDDVCEGCVYGKQQSFPVGKAWRTKEALEFVHTDICGPMNTFTLNKSRYFVLFTDDFTRISWVFFIV